MSVRLFAYENLLIPSPWNKKPKIRSAELASYHTLLVGRHLSLLHNFSCCEKPCARQGRTSSKKVDFHLLEHFFTHLLHTARSHGANRVFLLDILPPSLVKHVERRERKTEKKPILPTGKRVKKKFQSRKMLLHPARWLFSSRNGLSLCLSGKYSCWLYSTAAHGHVLCCI